MSRKLLGGALIALLAVYFIFKLTLPREFEWSQWDSMRSDDDNPLGCELFEEMAEATRENGYEVFDGDVEELFHKKEPFAILLMDHYFTAEGIFMTRIDSLVHSGCKLMIAVASFNVILSISS